MKTEIIDVRFKYMVEALAPRARIRRRFFVSDTIPVNIRVADNSDDFPVAALAEMPSARHTFLLRHLDGRLYSDHTCVTQRPTLGDDTTYEFTDVTSLARLDGTLENEWRSDLGVSYTGLGPQHGGAEGVFPIAEFERSHRVFSSNRHEMRTFLLDAVSKSVMFQGKIWHSHLVYPVWRKVNEQSWYRPDGSCRELNFLDLGQSGGRRFNPMRDANLDCIAGHELAQALDGIEGQRFGNMEILNDEPFSAARFEEFVFLRSVFSLIHLRTNPGVGDILPYSADTMNAYCSLRDEIIAFRKDHNIIPDMFEADVPDRMLSSFLQLCDAVNAENGDNASIADLVSKCNDINAQCVSAILERKSACAPNVQSSQTFTR
ncbi:hypothetical protein [Thalassospira xiamenensis]|uniref:Uncharacterized protein n=1 Tax=Thalassospira xiamenensis TaxID=220697 RepID=A0A285TRS5_9PROT|nr:hypothetical protein [Thalassospira xiamenensis]SOC26189.1 hypothetical protein SAMN05428964_10576 [Thalassospira xiamenensis]